MHLDDHRRTHDSSTATIGWRSGPPRMTNATLRGIASRASTPENDRQSDGQISSQRCIWVGAASSSSRRKARDRWRARRGSDRRFEPMIRMIMRNKNAGNPGWRADPRSVVPVSASARASRPALDLDICHRPGRAITRAAGHAMVDERRCARERTCQIDRLDARRNRWPSWIRQNRPGAPC